MLCTGAGAVVEVPWSMTVRLNTVNHRKYLRVKELPDGSVMHDGQGFQGYLLQLPTWGRREDSVMSTALQAMLAC